MKRLIPAMVFLLCILLLSAFYREPDTSDDLFDLVEVSDGVYAAIAKPSYKLNGNAAVIINENDVIVIDSHSTPSAAASLIKLIEKVTSKPIRCLINTHFHYDHARGNQAYFGVYPYEVTLISTEETRKNLISIEAGRVASEVDKMAETVARLEGELAANDNVQKRKALLDARDYYAEVKSIELVLPSMTFDRSMIIHRDSREIHLLFLGRAHTSSDLVVYLPDEKIVITGDLVARWLPGIADGYPIEWIATLDELAKLDIERVIVGHGEVAGPEVIANLRSYLVDLTESVKSEIAAGTDIEVMEENLYNRLRTKYTGRFPADGMEMRIKGNIRNVYQKLTSG
jgi:glyoxylase-like metal-dependent hydrolase (beta-lactamase superfamily II)